MLNATQVQVGNNKEIDEIILEIRQSGKQLYNNLKVQGEETKLRPEPFVVKNYKPNTVYWQGDLGIIILANLPSENLIKVPDFNLRLVPGPESRGSSHCLSSNVGVTYYTLKERRTNVLQGPILVFTNPIDITHPQHQDYRFTEECIIATFYQRSGANASNLERQTD